MTLSATNGAKRSVRHRGANVALVTVAAALALCLTVVGLVLAPVAASADSLTIISPAPSPAAAILVTAPTTVTVKGTKDAASTIRVPSMDAGAPFCMNIGAGETSWSCDVTLPPRSTEWDVAVFEDFPGGAPSGEAHVAIRVLGTPTIAGPALSTGAITGTATPGAGIVLSGIGSDSCPVAGDNGFWSCSPTVPSGTYTITATETWPGAPNDTGGSSAPFSVTMDKDAPAAPVFSQPTANASLPSQPITFAGSGENGGRVDVFVDELRMCSGLVSGGQWACSVTIPAGAHTVRAIQYDAAGNGSGQSSVISFTVAAAAVTPPTPEEPADPEVPVDPAPAPSAPAAPSPTPSASPPPAAMPIFPFFPPPIGGQSGLPPGETWGTPTYYGAAIPSLQGSFDSGMWMVGLLFGLGFVLLVALPLRMLVSALRGRGGIAPMRFAGRNRAVTDRAASSDDERLLGPWTTAALALAAAVALAVMAGGIQGEVRYLRLAFAIGLALLALNGVGVALSAKLTSRALGGSARIQLIPSLLAIAAVTALISRGGGIQPPIIVGVVIAAGFADEFGRRNRGLVSFVQLAVVAALGLAAWVAHSAVGPVTGFWASLFSESLAALCIAAFGSVVVMLLPVGRMPGRAVFEWSPVAWAAIALIGATLAGVVIATGASFPLPWVVGLACVFAAVSVATWSWMRFVEPQFAAETL